MNKKHLLLLLPCLVVGFIINSCKKDGQSPIVQLFTGGRWQLATVIATNYIGNTQTTIDTLNTDCQQTQFFTFNADKTCTYTNFDCLTQSSGPAPWSLTANQLFLTTTMVCKDTTASSGGSSMPFQYAEIYNLGQYSMVLQTGDIQPNYSLTKHRRIVQYGFIRVKAE